jgi:hypothetical protein
MNISFVFWFLMFLWLLSMLGAIFGPPNFVWVGHVSSIVLFILLALLGWQVFGAAVKKA